MPDTELDAESILLSAVMEPEGQDIDARQQQQPEEPDERQVKSVKTIDEEGAEEERKAEPAAKQATEEDDYVEIEGEEGQEPTRHKIKDLLESHTQLQAIKGREAETIERVEAEATQRVTARYQQAEQFTRQTALQLQAALQLIQPPQRPQPPNPALMQHDYARWEQESANYHQANYLYDQQMQQYQRAQGLAGELGQRMQYAMEAQKGEREGRELQKLQRAWPEFSDKPTLDKFVTDMGKEYGYSPEELDESLNDHRNALVARDALAYRAMKASGKDVKKAVEAKAPKIVRTKTEGRGGQQDRNAKGQYSSGALSALRTNHSDESATAFFAGLVRDGRI